jgi:hypothetical protein
VAQSTAASAPFAATEEAEILGFSSKGGLQTCGKNGQTSSNIYKNRGLQMIMVVFKILKFENGDDSGPNWINIGFLICLNQ